MAFIGRHPNHRRMPPDLAKLQKIKSLSLERTKVTYAGVDELKKALPYRRIYGP